MSNNINEAISWGSNKHYAVVKRIINTTWSRTIHQSETFIGAVLWCEVHNSVAKHYNWFIIARDITEQLQIDNTIFRQAKNTGIRIYWRNDSNRIYYIKQFNTRKHKKLPHQVLEKWPMLNMGIIPWPTKIKIWA